MGRDKLIAPRFGTALEWSTVNPVLGLNEIGEESDTEKQKRGDETTAWNDLPYWGSSSSSSNVLNRTGSTITFDSDAYYNKDNYLTSEDIVLDNTSAVNGKTAIVWCNGYEPAISGLTYEIASGVFSQTKLNIVSLNYVNSVHYQVEIRITNLSTLFPPSLVLTSGNEEITIDISPETDADNYKLYRSLDNFATAGTEIYDGSLLSYTDIGLTNGTTYYFRGLSEGSSQLPSGLGDIASIECGLSYDPDAQAFIDAVTGLDTTTQDAVNQLVLDIKAIGVSEAVWNKMLCINPKSGTTQSQQKWNLKDPRDLDAAYRFTYNGTVTHGSSGASYISSSSANTYFNINALALDSNFSYGMYITVAPTLTGDRYLIGAQQSAGTRYGLIRNVSASDIQSRAFGVGVVTTLSDSLKNGLLAVSLIGTDHHVFYKNDTPVAYTKEGTTAPNHNVFEGGLNLNGSHYNGANLTIGTSFYGEGLTDSEMASLRTAILNYETSIGRNI